MDNRRGQIALYVSFMEFGTFLQDESAWLPLGVCRTDIKKAVGASAITRAVVRKLFLERGENGFAIGCTVFHYRLHRFIADDAAGKDTLRYKGASGWKVCHNCKNVVLNQGTGTLSSHCPRGYLVPLSCSDASRFDPQSSDEFLSAYDGVRAVRHLATSGDDFENTEKAFGVSIDDTSVVADMALRNIMPPSTFVRDPVHTLFASGGTVQVEIFCIYHAVKLWVPDVWQRWQDGFKTWSTGRGGSAAPWYIFSKARGEATLSHKHFVGSASDALTVIPFLRNWAAKELHTLVDGMERHANSFERMCRVAELFLSGKRDLQADKVVWVNAVSRFLRSHVATYGGSHVKPKHHYMFHAGDQASEDGIWLDAFVLERRHKLAKATANNVHRINDIEKTMMTHMLATALQEANGALQDRCKWWRSPELDASVG